jgi:hypothetical protein
MKKKKEEVKRGKTEDENGVTDKLPVEIDLHNLR